MRKAKVAEGSAQSEGFHAGVGNPLKVVRNHVSCMPYDMLSVAWASTLALAMRSRYPVQQ